MIRLNSASKFQVSDVFAHTIEATLPDGQTVDIAVNYRYFDGDQVADLMAQRLPDGEFLERVIDSVPGIETVEGQPAPRDVALAAIKSETSVRTAAVRAYLSALAGAVAKNSSVSPAS